MLHCEYITQMKHFFSAYNFACKSMWKDSTDNQTIINKAKQAYDFYKKNCTRGKRLFRLTGQSGSGKTSQLLSATLNLCNNHKIKPIHIAVRNYAQFHPDYENLKNSKNMREQTNGFALKVLLWVLKFAFEDGLDIILEIALLNKKFENYIFFEIFSRNYRHFFQIMAVNKKISDIFIFKRQKKLHRNTSLKSAKYFDSSLQKTFNYLTKKYNFNCVVWSVSSTEPCFVGRGKNAYKIFKKNRKIIPKKFISESKLVCAKQNFLEELYRDGLI